MRKILVVGINEKIHSSFRVIEELRKKRIPYHFIKWSSLLFSNGEITSDSNYVDLKEYSSIFFDIPSYYLTLKKENRTLSFDLDNEFYIFLKKIKKENLPAMNRDFLIEHPFYNKFTQAEIFREKRIPSIPTLHLADNKPKKVLSAVKKFSFGFPLVVKESDGGLGDQVWKIENEQELEVLLKEKRNISLVVQPFIKNNGDFRVLIVGKKSAGIMKRSARKGEWRNNYAQGGKIRSHKEPAMEIFAEKVCRKMGMDYAGVDILKTKSGYQVIEVNSFARFEGFEKTHPKKNIGKDIVNYLISK